MPSAHVPASLLLSVHVWPLGSLNPPLHFSRPWASVLGRHWAWVPGRPAQSASLLHAEVPIPVSPPQRPWQTPNEVQPTPPHVAPSARPVSGGQAFDVPVQYSAWSQRLNVEIAGLVPMARQSVPAGT